MRTPSFLIIAAAFWSSAAVAAVDVHFYSKDLASSFPHAFVRLEGTVDGTGEKVDANYGFTAKRVSPAIMMGPVPGMIQQVAPDYVARSDRHFTLRLSDAQYRALLARIEKWRAAEQPSYRLNSRNCVHFVADIATSLGLSALPAPALMRKPRSFLEKVTRDNAATIAQWPALPDSAVALAQ